MNSTSSSDMLSPQYMKYSPTKNYSKNNNIDSIIRDYMSGLKNSSNTLNDSQKNYRSNPFESSDSFNLPKRTAAPLFSVKVPSKEKMRHSYPNNAFIRKTRDLRMFILSETERLVNQDNNLFLGANLRQEVEHMGNAPNCSIRKRMMRMGLL